MVNHEHGGIGHEDKCAVAGCDWESPYLRYHAFLKRHGYVELSTILTKDLPSFIMQCSSRYDRGVRVKQIGSTVWRLDL